ncbi:MAG: MBL fold metallo-hydrolase [Acidimicrobiia bacterium]|nr:MBL fold metallo-hydrolase [Acidimicrobiia bacterium]
MTRQRFVEGGGVAPRDVLDRVIASEGPVLGVALVGDHDDGLIVLEAPFTPVHGTDIVDAVNRLAPNAPITHVVQSHHHIDHASGVRSLVAAGATLVVGNGVRSKPP